MSGSFLKGLFSIGDRLFSETRFPGKYLHSITTVGALPSDSEDERTTKAILSLVAFFGFLSGMCLGIHDVIFQYPTKGAIAFSYAGMTLLGFIHFQHTKKFRVFRFVQLSLILLLPSIAQFVHGGFTHSGSGIIWSLAAPLCAVMFHGPAQSVRWYLAFLFSLFLAASLDSQADVFNKSLVIIQKSSPWFFFGHLAGISAIIFILIQYFVFRLRCEQEKSEKLLLNVLPQEIANRLKSSQETIADAYPEASILFADIAGFTKLSSAMSPQNILEMLNIAFSRFDRLADRLGLEKIKTIGDCYMVVGGIPLGRPDHAEAIAEMALEMQKALIEINRESGNQLALRIGINSGPVIAGVIGVKKFIYDLWGDAVNVASRMESTGIPGEIQITEATFELVKNHYRCSKRGMVAIKGKGDLTTYLLHGRITDQENPR